MSAAAANVITINGAAAGNNVQVGSGSTLVLTSSVAGFSLSMLTTLSQAGTIAGTLIVNANAIFNPSAMTSNGVRVTGTITNNGGTVTGSATGLTFAAGSWYTHNENGGAVPTATWNTTSTCNIIGITTTTPTGMAQNFGNFTYNCPGQTAIPTGFCYTAAGTYTIAGNLTVISTGTSYFDLISPAGAITVNIGGNINVQGGYFYLLGNNTGATIINVTGDISVSNGWLYLTGGSIVANLTTNVNGNMYIGPFRHILYDMGN